MVYGTSIDKASSLRSGAFGRLRSVMEGGREFLPTIDTLNVNCHVGKNGTCYHTGMFILNFSGYHIDMRFRLNFVSRFKPVCFKCLLVIYLK